MKALILVAVGSFAVCSCSPSSHSEEVSDYEPFPERFTEDLVALRGNAPFAMEDIAFSFPVFEGDLKHVRASIEDGDLPFESTDDFWKMEGDGAQPTVQFERISDSNEKPVRVRLVYGPVFQAYSDSTLPDTIFIYEFERGDGGWHKSTSRRVVSGTVTH